MIRVIRTVIGALVLALCAAPGASAGTQAHATTIVHVHVYDSHDHAVAATPSTGERGPPSLYDYNATLYGAVDRRSHGASARPDGTTPRPTYDYAHHAQLALVAQAAGTTGEPDRARVGDLSSLASGGVAANTRPAFIASADGVVVPTSRSRMVNGFDNAGFPSTPTTSPGIQYTLPDGTLVRIMEPSGQAPLRASFTNANGGAISPFTGKPVQPPPGLTKLERRHYVWDRTHVELGQ